MAQVWKFITSLRLTVVCLGLGIILVWVGTVAQADEGLYQAQARYFKHWLVVGATMYGMNLFEAYLLWRCGFLAPLAFRVAFYFVWHVVGGAMGL